MYSGRRYSLWATLLWSRSQLIWPAIWALALTIAYQELDWTWIGLPWLPLSLVGIAVAFYLGFKNNASYDRMWEARKLWGGIVNASRAIAISARDLVTFVPGERELHTDHDTAVDPKQEWEQIVRRHVAWLDALRHALRAPRDWEHRGEKYDRLRKKAQVPELQEDLRTVLTASVGEEEADEVLSTENACSALLGNQSKTFARLRDQGFLDGFSHMQLQSRVDELLGLQGGCERIKNFPFPRQYATVNIIFARLLVLLIPCGMLQEFSTMATVSNWATVPFSAIASWVFLSSAQIGHWSENPFEGLANDIPISSMSRAIERELLGWTGVTDLPDPRPVRGRIML
ncbi:MAG: bestrophin family ion channel [Planctomycetota bacterium]